MKKLLISTALLAVIALPSCGGEDEGEEITMCSCIKDLDAIEAEIMNGGGSPELAEKMQKKMKECGKIMEDYDPDKKAEILKDCE